MLELINKQSTTNKTIPNITVKDWTGHSLHFKTDLTAKEETDFKKLL